MSPPVATSVSATCRSNLMERRSFLKSVSTSVGAGSLAASGSSTVLAQEAVPDHAPSTHSPVPVNDMPRRKLGRTPLRVSIVTFPGLALMRRDEGDAAGILQDTFDRGVNYFDVAPAYGKDGECEIKMG